MKWVKLTLVILGFLAFSAVVFFAGPLIGFGESRPFEPLWVQLTIIGLLALILIIWGVIQLLTRKNGQAALEKALVADVPPTGDGRELAGRMQAALTTMKRSSGSKTYLYDLPWYVIIGPPGSGKTTALVNSEIKFPLAGNAQAGGLQGFGGTRYCDWWFAEDAILIDTAGRYTTQDSDQASDSASWSSFLNLLKKNRPKQPINGVILAFSVADLMRAEPATITRHAETVRARLAEIHETLKVDFPVYVMFTKADLIAGFREYFGNFPAARRKMVWGATFQTASRKDVTHDRVGPEYDALVSRLSDEVIDRLSEEADGVNRIAIFGLPGQMAEMRDEITSFINQVFEPTRYSTSAILRGFYFTSGTQEGTPIDQVLGAMGRSMGADASGLMSGKGKSYFLHDLLTKVVFGEQGWVSYDARAVRRSSVLRGLAMTGMILASAGMLAGWAWSYANNRQLVADAQSALDDYEGVATEDLQAVEVGDTDFMRVGNHLQILRMMPSGYESTLTDDSGWDMGFGLSQQGAIRQAARDSYAQGLERLFRPRLVLRVEEQLQAFVAGNEPTAIYEALKVYKALGGAAPVPQDAFVQQWFKADFEQVLFEGNNQAAGREMLNNHLAAMLEMDGAVAPTVTLNADLVAKSEIILARMTVADQAYALIKATAGADPDLLDFSLVEAAGPDARLVFETIDGRDLGELVVPALYTYDGFNLFFLDQLAAVAKKLEDEQWVLGAQASEAGVDDQLARLGPELLARYRDDFIVQWENMLAQLRLAPLAADKPVYQALGAAASPSTSPILKLVEAVASETRLTQARDQGVAEEAAETADAAGAALDKVGDRLTEATTARASGLQRIGLEVALEAGKSQKRAGAASGGGPIIPGEDIEVQFAEFATLMEGAPGQRPIDGLLASFGGIQQALIIAAGFNQPGADAQLPALIGQLRTAASRLPPSLGRLIEAAVEDFEGNAASSTIAQINADLAQSVIPACTAGVEGRYPFSGDPARQLPLTEFAQLFAPDGVLDRFFNTHLAVHANMGAGDWTWREESPIGAKLSLKTLREFQRAAAIRDAFFPGRSPTVLLDVTIIQTAAHDRIRQSVLVVDDQPVQMRKKGNTPVTIKWPGGGGMTSLQFLPDMGNRESQAAWQGPWALLQFVQEGSPRQVGDVLQVSHVLGGRNITYELRVNALGNPFNMAELREFSCPTGL